MKGKVNRTLPVNDFFTMKASGKIVTVLHIETSRNGSVTFFYFYHKFNMRMKAIDMLVLCSSSGFLNKPKVSSTYRG